MKTLKPTPVNDQEFFLASEADTPAVASDLLAKLKVTDAPFQEKVDAVTEWLAHHTPHKMLKMSLKRHGLPTA